MTSSDIQFLMLAFEAFSSAFIAKHLSVRKS